LPHFAPDRWRPEDGIRQLVDNPPVGPLSVGEFTPHCVGGISTDLFRSALCNTIQFKYLTEAVQP
jgi:hypothetical protein